MKQIKRLSVLFLCFLIIISLNVFSNAETMQDVSTYDYVIKGTRDYEKAYEVLEIVNEERRKAGVEELTMDKDLLENAMQRSSELVIYYSHIRPSGYSCISAITRRFSTAGENIAMYQTTSNKVMNSWMNSDGHRANILKTCYTCIGIGCYKGIDGMYYWTQLFTDGMPVEATRQETKETEETIEISTELIPFRDVRATDWYYGAVKYNVANKMILGYDCLRFAPNDKITRGQLVTILHRMEGQPYVSGTSKFQDVQDPKQYYYTAIKWATKNNIVSGYNDKIFGPNDQITREQMAVILNNYCIYKGKYKAVNADLSEYQDRNKISPFAKWGINWAVGSGVINGANGKLNPGGTATRAEAAAMLYKYCLNIK